MIGKILLGILVVVCVWVIIFMSADALNERDYYKNISMSFCEISNIQLNITEIWVKHRDNSIETNEMYSVWLEQAPKPIRCEDYLI